LELLATRTFKAYDEMYKVVDFLNKTLKDYNVIFGLSKDEHGQMVISIYKC
jgi:hypothetical protein